MLFKTASTTNELNLQTALRYKRKQVTHLLSYFLLRTLIIDYSFFSLKYYNPFDGRNVVIEVVSEKLLLISANLTRHHYQEMASTCVLDSVKFLFDILCCSSN